MIRLILFFGLICLLTREASADSLALYPRDSETREALTLNGVWNFRLTNYSLPENFGFTNQWYTKQLDQIDNLYERMPVPSSYNDITELRDIHDFSGWVWYDRTFFMPNRLQESELLLCFGSVNYAAVVYLNGKHVVNHTGGHLPFQVEVTKHVKLGAKNHISVAVSNVITETTIPQGYRNRTKDSRFNTYFYKTTESFAFYNYAGIQRSVVLYAVPKKRINDITVTTTISHLNNGIIHYSVTTNLPNTIGYALEVMVNDKKGKTVANRKGPFQGSLTIKNAQLWWPFTMSDKPGYMYRVAFSLYKRGKLVDRFYQMVGIRSVAVNRQHFLINGKPFYFRGFGKHEEYNVRGRALDQVMIAKDFNLIKWLGANSFRTSNYPYSEELMDEADAQGIVVIDETPAVALRFGNASFNNQLLNQHIQYVREMTERDKNRPSVVMWSIASEPNSTHNVSEAYFKKVIAEIRLQDKTRPVTAAISKSYKHCYLSGQLDVIMLNRYFGWNITNGYPQEIQEQIKNDILHFYHKFKKPIMISEYGAETIAGMHTEPTKAFSEDYQVELISEFHKGFDALRRLQLPFVGEHIWNFADFASSHINELRQIGGNKKGILTREREPKASARVLRCRYWQLAQVPDNSYQKGISYCPRVVY